MIPKELLCKLCISQPRVKLVRWYFIMQPLQYDGGRNKHSVSAGGLGIKKRVLA